MGSRVMLVVALLACSARKPPSATEAGADAATSPEREGPSKGPTFECPAGATKRQDRAEWWCERDGVRQGPYQRRRQDGSLEEEGTYLAGRREGRWTTWHANGRKARESHLKGGVYVGRSTEWDERGRVTSRGLYQRGSLTRKLACCPNDKPLCADGDMIACGSR